jgi:branched-chain amino acid transport system ATP-binding protein
VEARDELLRLDGVTKRFGGLTAVNDVSFQVVRGSVHGVIGPNGAGKSTLVNLIAGGLSPSEGAILFEGRDIGRERPHRAVKRGVARTFQGIQLFNEFTVLENVVSGYHGRRKAGMFGAMLGLPRERRERQEAVNDARAMLAFVGIESFEREPAAGLSYGHRRLLEIARALATSPKLVLLDEPAAGMNVNERQGLVGLIRRIQDDGNTVVVIEHHMDVIMTACETITVLAEGKKLSEGPPAHVQADPAVIAAYLGGVDEEAA